MLTASYPSPFKQLSNAIKPESETVRIKMYALDVF